jgi:hypothetical protein
LKTIEKLMYLAKNTERICPGFAARGVFDIEASCDAVLPVRKFAGDKAVTIW